MDFLEDIQKMGLTVDEYEACLNDIQDKVNGDRDIEWDEIRVKYNLPITNDTLRKANSKPFGGAYIKSYLESKNIPQDMTEALNIIRKEKQKLSDERAALKKISRDSARNEQNLEYLEKLIQERPYPEIKNSNSREFREDCGNDLLISFHDLHYGLDISNAFGTYNAEVAKEKVEKYFNEILKIAERHNSQNAWVLLGGDLISGRIHPGIQLQNRENTVEQVQGAAELISMFVYKLSEHFNQVFLNGTCGGNHSRLDTNKDMVLRGERLDLLIPWYINARLAPIANIKVLNDSVDPTIAIMNIRGKNYIGVHGDFDAYSEKGVHRLRDMLDMPFESIIYGHLHHCSYNDVANVKIIRSGSFCDPIDDYSISKRITGRASQMVMVVDSNGVQTLYPVDLK